MTYGGLPQVAQFSVERQKAEYLKNIFSNVYIKDVVERNRIQNVDEIGALVDILVSHRAPTNPTKISNTFKSERGINYSNKTISKPYRLSCRSVLISVRIGMILRVENMYKSKYTHYFSDVGLRNAPETRISGQQKPTPYLWRTLFIMNCLCVAIMWMLVLWMYLQRIVKERGFISN